MTFASARSFMRGVTRQRKGAALLVPHLCYLFRDDLVVASHFAKYPDVVSFLPFDIRDFPVKRSDFAAVFVPVSKFAPVANEIIALPDQAVEPLIARGNVHSQVFYSPRIIIAER